MGFCWILETRITRPKGQVSSAVVYMCSELTFSRLVPTLVPTFAGGNEATRASMILCGPTSQSIRRRCVPSTPGLTSSADSVVIDRLKMYHMAGKFKLTGDGEWVDLWSEGSGS